MRARISVPARARARALVPTLALVAGACGQGEVAPAGDQNRAPQDTVSVVTGEWVTVLARTMENKQPTPEAFTSRSDSLRVITTLGPLLSPYSPGLVITNILSDRSALPMASVRAEQNRVEMETVDTTVVAVGAGRLEFFVPEHRGLVSWSVELQEFRPAD